MASIGDSAKIVGGELPDVDDPDALELACFQVWELVLHQYLPVGSTKLDDGSSGKPGKLWSGSLESAKIKIWPRLQLQYNSKDAKEMANAKAVSIAINNHLRKQRNLVCIKAGSKGFGSTWWVADRFTSTLTSHVEAAAAAVSETAEAKPVFTTETKVTASRATTSIPQATFVAPRVEPVTSPAQVEDPDDEPKGKMGGLPGDFECRHKGCGRILKYARLRAGHERLLHGEVYSTEGKLIQTMDPTKPVEREDTVKLIVQALVEAPGSLPRSVLQDTVRMLEPRLSKAAIDKVVAELLDDPSSGVVFDEEKTTKHYTYYAYQAPANQAAVKTEENEGLNVASTPTKPTAKAAETKTAPKVTIGDAIEAADLLKDTLIQLQQMEAELQAKGAGNAELEAKVARLEAEIKAGGQLLKTKDALLASLRTERDNLRAQLDALQKSLE